MRQVLMGALGLLVMSAPAQAARVDTIDKLLDGGDDSGARKKCERWEAWLPTVEPSLRAACARAFEVEAKALDTPEGWAAFRKVWKDTPAGRAALEKEAESALRLLPMEAGERALLDFAARYPETLSGDEALLGAKDAAIRDASTAEEAREVARRYPDHAGLGGLVERFPGAFVSLVVSGREVKLTVDPPVPLTGGREPELRWVAAGPEGSLGGWDEVVRQDVLDSGVPGALIGARGAKEGPQLPLCVVPGRDLRPAIEVRVGKGELLVDQPWDEGCGTDSWPAFLALRANKVQSVSLAPGHRIDLEPKGLLARLAGAPLGTPVLSDGYIYRRSAGPYLVWAVTGGAPWLSAIGPSEASVPLDGSLLGPGLPGGWSVAPAGDLLQVRHPSIPAGSPPWEPGSGQLRVLSPIVQKVLGLSRSEAEPKNPRAPALAKAQEFKVLESGLVVSEPPPGATRAGLYSVRVDEQPKLLAELSAVGLVNVQVLDAWRVDLDGDKVPETVVRARVDGMGQVILLDPFRKNAPRTFAWETESIELPGGGTPTPFTFRRGLHTYLAWAGMRTGSLGERSSLLVNLRSDGESYAFDELVVQVVAPLP